MINTRIEQLADERYGVYFETTDGWVREFVADYLQDAQRIEREMHEDARA